MCLNFKTNIITSNKQIYLTGCIPAYMSLEILIGEFLIPYGNSAVDINVYQPALAITAQEILYHHLKAYLCKLSSCRMAKHTMFVI